MMEQLNLPSVNFTCRTNADSKTEIFDSFRKKYVLLTPEEWVRQHFAHYLSQTLGVPISLMALEKKIIMNGLKRRFDIVVYSKEITPLLIVECKATSVPVTQAVFDQAARYNSVLKAPYLVVTNGLVHHACKIDFTKANIEYLNSLPLYSEMISNP
jgi:type I site-specific restriction endonuclease